VIEVKSTITLQETRSIVEGFVDFGQKWRRTQEFYRAHHQNLSIAPQLSVVAWSIGKTSNGKDKTNAAAIRNAIGKAYAEAVSKEQLDHFPLLGHMMIYNEAEISLIYGNSEPSGSVLPMHLGWHSGDGRFRRFDKNGKVYRDKDSTIASLLANLHMATGRENFNRFFSYADEARDDKLLPYPHAGLTWVWHDLSHVQRL